MQASSIFYIDWRRVGLLLAVSLATIILLLLLVGIMSPVLLTAGIVCPLWPDDVRAKSVSDVSKNAVEALAIIAGILAAAKWLTERSDRATDVLLNLDKEFCAEPILEARELIEHGDIHTKDYPVVDRLLRFYLLVYAVKVADQVPVKSLSICFRYYLAHHYRTDRPGFRDYINREFPTLRDWLLVDAKLKRNSRRWFFCPTDFWPEAPDGDEPQTVLDGEKLFAPKPSQLPRKVAVG